jgi:hypothetical protein
MMMERGGAVIDPDQVFNKINLKFDRNALKGLHKLIFFPYINPLGGTGGYAMPPPERPDCGGGRWMVVWSAANDSSD